MDIKKQYGKLSETIVNQKKNIIDMAIGNESLSNIKPSPLFLALEMDLPYNIIEKLLANGARTDEKMPRLSNQIDIYPLTIAFRKRYSLDYIKILHLNCMIPPIYIIGILKYYQPTDDIVKYLLEDIDIYLNQIQYITEWNLLKWEASFWKKGVLWQTEHILEPYWNFAQINQSLARGIRQKSHAIELDKGSN